VTNLAFLSGFAAIESDIHLVRIAGAASILAEAISMFFSGILAGALEYESSKADKKREAAKLNRARGGEGRVERLLHRERLDSGRSEKIRRTNRLKQGKVSRRHSDARTPHSPERNCQIPIKMGGVIGLSFLVGALIL